MSTTTRLINAAPDRVYAVLADGWTYSDWVVGTVHIRAVDAGYPDVGTSIHHKAGPWPLSLHDRSTVLDRDPGRMLLLKIRLWPLGAGQVRFDLEPVGSSATRVTIREQFTEGPLLGLRNKVNDVVLHLRNRETLHRLDDLAVNRIPRPAQGGGVPTPPVASGRRPYARRGIAGSGGRALRRRR